MSRHVYIDLTSLVRTRPELNQAPQALDMLAWTLFGLLVAVDMTLAWG